MLNKDKVNGHVDSLINELNETQGMFESCRKGLQIEKQRANNAERLLNLIITDERSDITKSLLHEVENHFKDYENNKTTI